VPTQQPAFVASSDCLDALYTCVSSSGQTRGVYQSSRFRTCDGRPAVRILGVYVLSVTWLFSNFSPPK
jgi:hypothetical protein